jgi:hypothetical protein
MLRRNRARALGPGFQSDGQRAIGVQKWQARASYVPFSPPA